MIGISIAAKKEWEVVLKKYDMNIEDCNEFPFGEYFTMNLHDRDVIFYRCGVRKMNSSASTQYMIDHFNLSKIIVIGTCAGIDSCYKPLDIVIPNKLVQYDCTIKEIEPLIKDSFTISLDLSALNNVNTGTLGTADKALVMADDYYELLDNGITVADTEAAAIAYICKANYVECLVIKGISDFPIQENDLTIEESYTSQLDTFITNIPVIMNNILDNYLELALKNHIQFIEDKPKDIARKITQVLR